MTNEEIDQLRTGLERSGEKEVQLLETHISWILLGDTLAWKIKKPVRFDYLDFTSPEARHELCKRELFLNQRLAPDIYLAVTPVVRTPEGLDLGVAGGEVIDYAVAMKKLDNDLLLSKQLRLGNVTEAFIVKLAQKLSDFHMNEPPVSEEWDGSAQLASFSDIRDVAEWLEKNFDPPAPGETEAWVRLTAEVHRLCEWRFRQRVEQGFYRDGHGDLHSGNIFYYPDDPVIFDCIEFSDAFRKIDVLYEIAFLCMDLDFHDRGSLRRIFLEAYQEAFPAIVLKEDVLIFKYYCFVRASIRLKVSASKAIAGGADDSLMKQIEGYAALTSRYAGQLRKLIDQYITFEKEAFRIQDAFE